MPSGKNWLNFIYINLAFAVYISATFYLNSVQEIKKNWPQYRCNPFYMPLSDDIEKDFAYCIQNIQTNFMGYLLQPITYITSSLTGILSSFMNEINMVRAMFNKIRNFISSIIQSVFGVFLNMVIEFQRITIGIKDLIGKTIGIVMTLLYVMDGSIKTMRSTWNGPPGQLVKALGKCFYPHTKILLKNGSIKSMKELDLGDILSDGSVVEAVMKIDNKLEPVSFYEIPGTGVDGETIYVTGSHLVFNDVYKQFMKVEDYYKSKKSTFKTDWFSCLITDTHKIPIGNEIFWDWEDHYVKPYL